MRNINNDSWHDCWLNSYCLKPINHPTAASYVRTNILTDYNIEQAYAQT